LDQCPHYHGLLGNCSGMANGQEQVETFKPKYFKSWKVVAGILLVLCLVLSTSSLQCYHCLERPKSTEKHLSCAYFDMSAKFQKECTHSTFCMKRTSLYQLHNGSFITIYVHKCADQSHKTMVQDGSGDWGWAQLLRLDLYNEGCEAQHSPSSLLTTQTSHCFCSSDYCNSSSSRKPSNQLLIYSVACSLVCLLLSRTRFKNNFL